MNAKTVQKWIRKNAPDYMLVRRVWADTLSRQNRRLEEIERQAGRLVDALDDPDADLRVESALERLKLALAVPVPRATDKISAASEDDTPEDPNV